MMFSKRLFLCALLLLPTADARGASSVAEAKIIVSVTDEHGQPVSNAHVSVAFDTPRSALDLWKGLKAEHVGGLTDGHGMFTASGQTVRGIRLAATLAGYYKSTQAFQFSKEEGGRWTPYSPTLGVVLRKRDDPVPLLAKKLHSVELPATDAALGYDLLAGDWVAPHGRGVEPDLAFTLVRDYRGRFEYSSTLTIAMTGKHDGFVGIQDRDVIPESELRFPREAPDGEYDTTNIVLTVSVRPGQGEKLTYSTATQNFFFRVRTEVDENGRVKKALYGKLIGPIEWGLHDTKTGKLRLTYYVNPEPNDRNLEFDPEKNLFKNLKWFEQVKEP